MQRDDSFELLSNEDDAGNFDDIVYTAGGQRYFLQLKHANNPDKKKLTERDLEGLLLKCFNSYFHIKSNHNFKDIPIDNSQFIIYTNRELESELSQHERKGKKVDIFFKTLDQGIFNFIPQDKKRRKLYTLLENAVKNSKRVKVPNDQELNSLISEFLNS